MAAQRSKRPRHHLTVVCKASLGTSIALLSLYPIGQSTHRPVQIPGEGNHVMPGWEECHRMCGRLYLTAHNEFNGKSEWYWTVKKKKSFELVVHGAYL